ncbi:MAG: hypothetical protein QF535_23985 [Anaerolineales bacterium]|jgi:hypothetical protein|nr:hypothetical protein [Anaerolineales bacterium]
MAENTITVTEEGTVQVSVSTVASAGSITIDPSTSDLIASTAQTALEELALEKFSQAAAPTTGVTEGDLWYDTDDDKFYARDEDSWNEVVTAVSGTVDGGSY